MSWTTSENHGGAAVDAYHTETLWGLLQFLLANGHTVTCSGDGLLLYSAAGNILTGWTNGGAFFAAQLSNRFAWFVERGPDGTEWCWCHDPTSIGMHAWLRLVVLPGGAPFSGGNATTRATSVDEVSPDGAAVATPAYFVQNTWQYWHFVHADADVNGIRPWYAFGSDNNPWPGFCTFCVGIMSLQGHDTGDTSPCMTIDTRGQAFTVAQMLAMNSQKKGAYYDHGGGAEAWMEPSGLELDVPAGTITIPNSTLPAVASGKYHSAPVWLVHANGGLNEWKGQLPIVWNPHVTGQNSNKVWRDQNGDSYVPLYAPTSTGGLFLPGWDPTVLCLPDLGGGLTVTDFVLHGAAPSPDTTPPTLAVVSPSVGSTITATTPFVIDVTDDVGLRLSVLTTEMGIAHEVVWLLDSFAPLYAAGSTRVAIVGGYRYTIRRAGGWTSSPTFRVEAIDTAGNLGT